MTRKFRFGMIGGGRGAFIGAVHRIAALMDGKAELVAGAFSSDAARSQASGADLGLDPSRVYGSFADMAKAEAAPELRLVYLEGSAELLAQRTSQRQGHFMPPSLLASQLQTLGLTKRKTKRSLLL